MTNGSRTLIDSINNICEIYKQDPNCLTKHDLNNLETLKRDANWLLVESYQGPMDSPRHHQAFDRMHALLRKLEKKCADHHYQKKWRDELLRQSKYNPYHKPAGSPEGGEFDFAPGGGSGDGAGSSQTGISAGNQPAGGGSTPSLPGQKPHIPGQSAPRGSLREPPDHASGKRARAIYGETSGLTPALKNPKASPYNADNHDTASSEQLARARAYIGIVSERNPRVHFVEPPSSGNIIEGNAWNDSVAAAVDKYEPNELDPRINHFYLRQDGIGTQVPRSWAAAGFIRRLSLGPFNNVGGGDVPRGPAIYIDFYSGH